LLLNQHSRKVHNQPPIWQGEFPKYLAQFPSLSGVIDCGIDIQSCWHKWRLQSFEHGVDRPSRAWGFYGHRLNLYRKTVPHAGFDILRKWGEKMPLGYRVFTSNVDGQFQKEGSSL
jgi:hypothetical protein